MKQRFHIVWIVTLIITGSCGGGNVKKNGLSGTVFIDLENPQSKILDDNVVGDKLYIPLEFNAEQPIFRIDKLIICDEFIYVLDKSGSKGIHIFDLKGRYVDIIKNPGKGPGEYLELFDMNISHEGEIVLLSNAPRKLIYYGPKGKMSREVSYAFWTSSFAFLENEDLVFNHEGRSNGQEDYNLNVVHDPSSGKWHSQYFPFSQIYEDERLLGWTGKLDVSGKSILYSPVFSPIVYRLGSQKVDSAYVFSVGNHRLSPQELEMEPDVSVRVQKNSLTAFASGKIFQFRSNFENERRFISTFYYQHEEYFFHYSQVNNSYFIKSFKQLGRETGPVGRGAYGLYEDQVITVLDLDEILEMKKCLKNKDCPGRQGIIDSGLEYLEHAQSNVNPIIVFWRIDRE